LRAFLPLLVVLGLLVAGQRLSDPSTRATLVAMQQLGPIAGWRCGQSALYLYDPRHERADATLVLEPPEALAPSDVRAVRVEVNLRGGDTTVWTLPVDADPDEKPNRVLVMGPGLLRAVDVDGTTLCYSGLGSWFIVADHALQ
jgi:hypothetical protein